MQEPYESRKQELENQRTVVPQAPELLNLALLVNGASVGMEHNVRGGRASSAIVAANGE